MQQYEDDIKHIRSIMERSSSFVSLSGLSGIGAGLTALIGCGLTFYILESYGIDYFDGKPNYYSYSVLRKLALVAIVTLAVSLFFGMFFTLRKAKRLGLKTWSTSTKQLLVSLLVPLIVGGILCLIFVYHLLPYLVAPTMLIFYGLALVSASKYTMREVFGLGVFEILLGLASAIWIGYGLVFWGVGFGILHIIYGIWMHVKYQ